MIRKTRNFFLGFLSFIPVVSLIATIISFGEWVAEGVSIYNFQIEQLIPIVILQLLNIVLTCITVSMMALHASKCDKLDKQQLALWILLLAFFSIISLPVYWIIYVKDDKEEKVLIKEYTIEEKPLEESNISIEEAPKLDDDIKVSSKSKKIK